ncbi:MAG: hypothetical protein AB7S38_06800 [Vulcanimicrobiota bacterium]
MIPGPVLEGLTRRLAECPPDFLAEPRRANGQGSVVVGAVVSDLLQRLGAEPLDREAMQGFVGDDKSRNRLRITLVACWLLADPALLDYPELPDKALVWLEEGFQELAALVDPTLFVTDPDRREELARLCLDSLDLLPAGESRAQAQDRLTTLSSVERERVIQTARQAQERARLVREELARKQAAEAAAAWSNE